MNDDSRIGYANQVYTRELVSVLTEPLYQAVMDIYRREANMTQNKNDILVEFQKRLKDIPNWNQNIINEHVSKASVNCGFLQDLLAAVYFSNVKILSSVKIKKSKKKVHVKLPALDDFIHRTMIEIAKRIYANPKCFSYRVYGSDMNNKDEVYPIIEDAINEANIKSLPFQNILQTYFGDKLHGGDSSSEEDSNSESEDENNYPSDNELDNQPKQLDEQNDPPRELPQSNNGFFDRNENTEPEDEIKDVPIQKPGTETKDPMEKQNPVLFPDAADDPTDDPTEMNEA